MAGFYEEILHEYPSIPHRKTWTKDVKYRIRVIKRMVDGIPRVLLDIRTYIVTEKTAMLTESGVYFTLEELDKLIPILQESRKYFIRRQDAPRTGNRAPDTFFPKKTK